MPPPPIPLETLYGTWKLVAEERTVIEGEKSFIVPTDEIGAGYITYTRDGRMNAMIVRAARPVPESIAGLVSLSSRVASTCLPSELSIGNTNRNPSGEIVR